jgi:hypothetical protein
MDRQVFGGVERFDLDPLVGDDRQTLDGAAAKGVCRGVAPFLQGRARGVPVEIERIVKTGIGCD